MCHPAGYVARFGGPKEGPAKEVETADASMRAADGAYKVLRTWCSHSERDWAGPSHYRAFFESAPTTHPSLWQGLINLHAKAIVNIQAGWFLVYDR